MQESSGTITPAKASPVAEEEEKDHLIVGGDEIVREIKIIKTDRHSLPSKEDLWELMKAAVGGATITLTGYSGSLTEPMRVKWANTIKAGANAGQFAITVGAVEPDVCIGVLTSIQGWVSVKAGTTTETTFPVDVDTATTDCGTAAVSMVFTGN